MGKLTYLIIHCTATPEDREVTKEDIEIWHLQQRGWSKVGYTDLIQLDGNLVNLTPFDQDDEVDGFEITNGVRGKNSISRHVVYAGGVDEDGLTPCDTRTIEQLHSLQVYVTYMVMRHPNILVAGHNQFDSGKACPSFDVPSWLESICVPEKNIYRG